MNPNTGATYPVDLSNLQPETFERPDVKDDEASRIQQFRQRREELLADLEAEAPEDLVEIAGSPEAVGEAIEKIKDRVASMGGDPDAHGLSRREVRRMLQRDPS